MIIGQNSKEHDKSFTDVTMVKATGAYPTLSQTCVWIIPIYNMQTHANTCLRNHWTASWDQDAASALGAACDPPPIPHRSFPHCEKKTIPWKCQSVLPAATGTQTPGLMLIAKALWIRIIFSPQKSLFAEATYPSLVAMKVNTHLCLFTLWKYKYIYTYSFTFNTTKYNVVHTLELNEFF